MKSVFLRLSAVACLLGFGATATAQVPYTYIDVQATFADSIQVPAAPVGSKVDGVGARVEGSLGIFPWLYLAGGVESIGADDYVQDDGVNPPAVYPGDDVNTYNVGIGFNTPAMGRSVRQYRGGVIDQYSLFADARYQGQERYGIDVNGWQLNAGLRSVNFTRLETILGVGYDKFESLDGEFTFQGQLLVRVVGNLQLRGGINWSDDISRWNVGLRYHFGNWTIFH